MLSQIGWVRGKNRCQLNGIFPEGNHIDLVYCDLMRFWFISLRMTLSRSNIFLRQILLIGFSKRAGWCGYYWIHNHLSLRQGIMQVKFQYLLHDSNSPCKHEILLRRNVPILFETDDSRTVRYLIA